MYMSINPRHILAGLVIMASQLLSAQTLSDGQTLVKNAMLTPQDEQMVLTMDVCLDDPLAKEKYKKSICRQSGYQSTYALINSFPSNR